MQRTSGILRFRRCPAPRRRLGPLPGAPAAVVPAIHAVPVLRGLLAHPVPLPAAGPPVQAGPQALFT